jgi:hypothetical protein
MPDHNDAYDPNAAEGDTGRGSQHMSWKDIKVIGLVIVVLIICLLPIYNMGVKNSEKVRCIQNMKSISEAISLYAKDHDDGLPPVYRTGVDFSPDLGAETGRPYTWASDTVGYLGPRSSFRCPSASEDEVVQAEDPKSNKATVPMTYGMYAPYGGLKTYNIESPDRTILFAETSNLGAATSYDPTKFNVGGKDLPDGFVIGWDDSNYEGSSASHTITRLAFRKTSTGNFDKQAEGRHEAGIHAVTVSGTRLILEPKNAIIVQQDKLPGGMWAVPPLRKSKPKTP